MSFISRKNRQIYTEFYLFFVGRFNKLGETISGLRAKRFFFFFEKVTKINLEQKWEGVQIVKTWAIQVKDSLLVLAWMVKDKTSDKMFWIDQGHSITLFKTLMVWR